MYYFYFLDRPVIKEAKSLRVNLNDFEIKTIIGKGYFGEVHVSFFVFLLWVLLAGTEEFCVELDKKSFFCN